MLLRAKSRLAAVCASPRRETDPVVKVLLRSMARSWLGLADQAPLAIIGTERDISIQGPG